MKKASKELQKRMLEISKMVPCEFGGYINHLQTGIHMRSEDMEQGPELLIAKLENLKRELVADFDEMIEELKKLGE